MWTVPQKSAEWKVEVTPQILPTGSLDEDEENVLKLEDEEDG